MKSHNYLLTVLTGIAFFSSSASAADFYIAEGVTGSVGYHSQTASPGGLIGYLENIHKTGFSQIRNDCSDFSTVGTEQKGFIEQVPGQNGVYGFKFAKAGGSSGNGYFLGAPDVTWSYGILSDNGGQTSPYSHSVVNSKVTGSLPDKVWQRGPLCFSTYSGWAMYDYLNVKITGFHLYTVGVPEAGRYVMTSGYAMSSGINRININQKVYNNTAVGSATGGSIYVLKTCDIIPTTPTNIIFSNQLAGRFTGPTLLESSLAGITFNCNKNGSGYIYLSPHNRLKVNTKTGMDLQPAKTNAVIRPYIVTSLSTTPLDNSICNDNATNALKYNELISINKRVQANTGDSLSYYFNLCGRGQIQADSYTGSIDVRIVVQ